MPSASMQELDRLDGYHTWARITLIYSEINQKVQFVCVVLYEICTKLQLLVFRFFCSLLFRYHYIYWWYFAEVRKKPLRKVGRNKLWRPRACGGAHALSRLEPQWKQRTKCINCRSHPWALRRSACGTWVGLFILPTRYHIASLNISSTQIIKWFGTPTWTVFRAWFTSPY